MLFLHCEIHLPIDQSEYDMRGHRIHWLAQQFTQAIFERSKKKSKFMHTHTQNQAMEAKKQNSDVPHTDSKQSDTDCIRDFISHMLYSVT